MRQDAPELLKDGEPLIINLDESEGTHWVAARLIDDTLFYADPFGSTLMGYPPQEIATKKMVINRVPFQPPSSKNCGYYALCFMDALRCVDKSTTQDEFERLLWASIA